ncbi:MAG: phenylalanine--tRNA ligase subunit alpha, partial [Synechococcus sp. SB0663_bin_10]|nr:phenylalanine--tRNA ligase subunit alpha [Synechococcus sp. SB0663_bin_10]
MSTPADLDTLTSQLDALEAQASDQIRRADSAPALEQLRISLLGKKGGQLSSVLRAMGSLPHAQRPLLGQRANVLKKEIQGLLGERHRQLEATALSKRLTEEAVDVSAPALYRP